MGSIGKVAERNMPKPQSSGGIIPQIVDFFSSVKLALVLLLTLAVTSVLGTILPQGEAPAFYGQRYSPTAAGLIHFFQLADMYHSWWFQWLLFLLAINLIACSLKRFPTIWKVFRASPRPVTEPMFDSLPFNRKVPPPDPALDLQTWVKTVLGRRYGKMVSLSPAEGKAFYLEKGRFSRFGVYLVHLSVLVIFLGALIGSFYGFKGSLELREGESRDRIFIKGRQTNQDLGFSIKLDRFSLSYYPDGMPKEYRSDLSIWEEGREKEKAVIRVNDPYTYKGITFYQSTWDQYPTTVNLSLKKGEQEFELPIQMDRITPIPESPYTLQAVRYVTNFSNLGPALGVFLLKDRVEIEQGWILVDHPEFRGNRLGEFLIKVKEIKTRYVSGLQVNRDPGVWFIWIGCSLMLIGFIIAFYLSHQQIWVWIREKKTAKGKSRTEILIGGTAHKNREAFVRRMESKFNRQAPPGA